MCIHECIFLHVCSTLVYMSIKIIEVNECKCNKCEYVWVTDKVPVTCANKKCRSWKWNEPIEKPVAVSSEVTTLIPEIEKKSLSYGERVTLPLEVKSLHPGRSDEERKNEIASLKSLTDKENYKKESALPPWPTTPAPVDDYGPVLHYE